MFANLLVNELQARGTNELIITVNYDLVCTTVVCITFPTEKWAKC